MGQRLLSVAVPLFGYSIYIQLRCGPRTAWRATKRLICLARVAISPVLPTRHVGVSIAKGYVALYRTEAEALPAEARVALLNRRLDQLCRQIEWLDGVQTDGQHRPHALSRLRRSMEDLGAYFERQLALEMTRSSHCGCQGRALPLP